MKKILTGAICLLAASVIATPMAFAADALNSQTDVNISITPTDTSKPDFSWDSSPNVQVGVSTSDYRYVIETTNLLTNAETGYCYITSSNATGYAQLSKEDLSMDAGDEIEAPGLGEISGDWNWVGGSGT